MTHVPSSSNTSHTDTPTTQQVPERASQVNTMFDSIAHRYDLLNRLLSFGVDGYWRRDAVKAVSAAKPQRILDVATGTADLAIALKKAQPTAEVIGADFSKGMLDIAQHKITKLGLNIDLQQADGMNLPYPDNSFDTVSIAYGLRNFANYEKGLQEFYRVLRPGGRLVVLEFPPPPRGLFGQLFRFYFMRVVPLVGGLISRKRSAYSYLPQSVLHFPTPDALCDLLSHVGFTHVTYKRQTFGISALHIADKAVP